MYDTRHAPETELRAVLEEELYGDVGDLPERLTARLRAAGYSIRWPSREEVR